MKNNFFHFLFNKKFIHIVVAFLTFTIVFANHVTKTKAEELAHSANKTILADLISNEFNEFVEDEKLIVETFDSEVIISQTQQTYLDNIGKLKPKLGLKTDKDEDDLIEEQKREDKKELMREKRTETINYVVESGDTISTIASNFGISVSTILWENDLTVYSVIRPGDSLKILPTNGVSHKVVDGESLSGIARKYEIETDKIMEANKLAKDSFLKKGQVLIIPGGKRIIEKPITTPSKTYSAYETIKEIVKAPNAKPVAGNKMQWPTQGHRITQYYNWKHSGLDVANEVGTPLYAADAGTVEISGWGNGYGNQVLIDHGGGKKTRYGHASKLYVKAGDKVAKGETIAAMGSTGWSTGSHLHFEVIIDGKKYNPLDYIK